MAYYSARKLTLDPVVPSFQSGLKINIGDSWKAINYISINISDIWKQILKVYIAISGDATWESVKDMTWQDLLNETWDYQINHWKVII